MASPRSESIVQAFISRHRTLLAQERVAEIERTSLTLSNASPKLLEQRGLALGGLSIVSAGVGLGGKTYVIVSYHRSLQHLMYTVKRRLVELERPSAFHPSPVFPPHTFRVVSAGTIASLMEPELCVLRPGDLARIEENVSTTQKKFGSKGKKVQPTDSATKSSSSPEGVVYKVCINAPAVSNCILIL